MHGVQNAISGEEEPGKQISGKYRYAGNDWLITAGVRGHDTAHWSPGTLFDTAQTSESGP